MHFSKTTSLLWLSTLAAALPQTPNNVPTCAYPAFLTSLQATGCTLSDTTCVCGKTELLPSITEAVVEACGGSVSADDITSFIASYCGRESGAVSSIALGTSTTAMTPAYTETTVLASTTVASSVVPGPTAIVGNATTTGSFNGTHATTTWQPFVTPSTLPSNAAQRDIGVSVMAFVLAVGGMMWAFAEL